jgi:hypothetical protein
MRRLSVLVVLAAVAGPFGCTSLLGDFSSGTAGGPGDGSPGPTPDGSSDDAAGDATTPPSDGTGGDGLAQGDAPPAEAEAAAPLQLLTCDQWQNPQPTVVVRLFAPDGSGGGGNNGSPFNQFFVEHVPSTNTARIVVATGGPGSATSVYTVSEQGGGSPHVLSLPNTGLAGEQKTTGAVTFLVNQYAGGGYAYYSIADADPGNGTLAAPLLTVSNVPNQATGGGGGNNFQMEFVEMGVGSFYALSSYTASGGGYNLVSWLSNQSAWQTLIAAGQQITLGSPLIHNGASVYGFFGPPGGGGNGPTQLSEYTFDTAVPGIPSPRSVIAAGSTAAAIAAASGPGGSYSLGFVELSGAQSALVHAGNVAASKITTFMVEDLPSLSFDVQSDGGFFDTTPFNGHNGSGARWMSNGDLGLLGGGGTGSGSYTGLNFYVATPNGQWLVETAGTGKNVLAGHTISGSAFDLASSAGGLLLQFDLAWVEQETDGSYALNFNELNCHL